MLVGEAISRVRGFVQDSRTPYRYSDESLLGYLNLSLNHMVLLRPDLFSRIYDVVAMEGVLQELSERAVRLVEVFSKNDTGGYSALIEVDREVMDRTAPTWQKEAAGPAFNWMRHPRNPKVFFLYPPSEEGQDLRVEFTETPPNLVFGENRGDSYVGYEVDDDGNIDENTIMETNDTEKIFPTVYDPVLINLTVFYAESVDDEAVESRRAELFLNAAATALGVTIESRRITDVDDAAIEDEPTQRGGQRRG